MVDQLPNLRTAGFLTKDGLEQGITPGRLRGPSFAAPFRGIRTFQPPDSVLDRALAYAPLLRPWQCLGGVSALAVLGLPLPWRLRQATHVDVVSDWARSRPVRDGVHVRRVPARLLGTWDVDGVRVASAPTLWALMASRWSVHELVMLGDAIVSKADNYPNRRLTGPLATADALHAVAGRWSSSRGASRMAQALPRIREGVESPRETEMRLLIVDAGMPEPEVQVSIHDPDTRVILGRADLLHRDARVVEEYEGDGHREKGQWDRDIEKYREFERIGLHVVRATNRDLVPRPERWLSDLAAQLRSRTP